MGRPRDPPRYRHIFGGGLSSASATVGRPRFSTPNVIRLLSRLTGVKESEHEDYLRLLWNLVPDDEHECFNYGLIDLGALVCHYKSPQCGKCPLKDLCVEYLEKTGSTELTRKLEEVYRGYIYGYQRGCPNSMGFSV